MKHITPHLWFEKGAKEAAEFYTSIFKNSKITHVSTIKGTPGGDTELASFELDGQPFMAIGTARPPQFVFNEAISFLIPCESQEEIDYYWEKLSADPELGQCGWLKDKFGVSWQVWPTVVGEMFTTGTPEQIERVMQAFMKMKKFVIAELQKAFEGK